MLSQKWFNKNGEVKVRFTRMELPDGRATDVSGYIHNNRDGYLRENRWKKLIAYTIGGAAIGTGAGMAVGIPTDEVGAGFAIGTSAGAGAGLIGGLVTKV